MGHSLCWPATTHLPAGAGLIHRDRIPQLNNDLKYSCRQSAATAAPFGEGCISHHVLLIASSTCGASNPLLGRLSCNGEPTIVAVALFFVGGEDAAFLVSFLWYLDGICYIQYDVFSCARFRDLRKTHTRKKIKSELIMALGMYGTSLIELRFALMQLKLIVFLLLDIPFLNLNDNKLT